MSFCKAGAENDFYRYKTNAYVRLNNIGLLEYIDLQKERYGSKTFQNGLMQYLPSIIGI